MRHMEPPPAKAALPDGTVMAGNVFERNIVAWCNPAAKLLAMRNVSFEHNPIDHNLYFHFGQPMETGVNLYGRVLSKNLAPNPGFERGKQHAMPQDWQWQIHPLPTPRPKARPPSPHLGNVRAEDRRRLQRRQAARQLSDCRQPRVGAEAGRRLSLERRSCGQRSPMRPPS